MPDDTICPACNQKRMVALYIRTYRSPRRKRQDRVGWFCRSCHHVIIAVPRKEEKGAPTASPVR